MKKLIELYNRYIEYFNLAFWLIVLWLSPQGIRFFDSSAAPIDLGTLSGILFAVAAIMIFKSVVWLLIRTIWPVFANYSKNEFETDFNTLSKWQKVLTYLSFYCFWAALLVVALNAFLH